MTTLTPLQAKAQEVRSWFEQTKRPGQDEPIWTMKAGHPEWVMDMVFKAHEQGQVLPDDYKYAFIVESLDRIEETDDPDEAANEIEADVYTSDLYAWLTSLMSRQGYVDEAVQEFGEPGGIVDQIMLGQVREKHEVYWTVLNFLRKQIEEEEDQADTINLEKCRQCGSDAIELMDVNVNGQAREGWVCDACRFVMLTPMSAPEEA